MWYEYKDREKMKCWISVGKLKVYKNNCLLKLHIFIAKIWSKFNLKE